MLGATMPRPYDRARILEAAARARVRNRRRQAIALFRRVLAVEPDNVDLHAKLAPLLARTGQHFDAWQSFQRVARTHLREKRADRALAVYREASEHLPRQPEAWLAVAALERKRGRPDAAVAALCAGRRHFRGRRRRAEAIHLLRRAAELDPANVAVALDLSRLLSRSGQRDEATLRLRRLEERCEGRERRRVLGAHWRLEPSLMGTWRWLRA